MTDMIEKARLFATAAHGAIGQLRKYTFEPYIVHPAEVSQIVQRANYCTDEMVAAAWLHDVLEDTKVTKDTLTYEFGGRITELVIWLSNVSTPKDGNRKKRKELDKLHLAKAPHEAQTIKLADLIANTPSIVKHDPKFAKTYLVEKEALLEVLTKGDMRLWNEAYDMIIEAKYEMITNLINL